MTAQIAERLVLDGRSVGMCSTPLGGYFALSRRWPDFEPTSTALWRGYVGTWEFVENRLYLTALAGRLSDGSQACLATVFPDFPKRVFAHWYNGELRVPQGQLLEYVHAGYASRYERDLLLRVERGVLINTQIRHHGVAEDKDSDEGYGISAMTVLPVRRKTSEATL